MSVPCITRLSRNYQHYALYFTTPVFYTLSPTCLGSSLPSSGRFLERSELPETQIEWLGYHIMCDYVTCVQDCLGSDGNPAHRPRNHTLYDIPPIQFVFQVTQNVLRSSLMMAGYCRDM
jgi:hypothetical protein